MLVRGSHSSWHAEEVKRGRVGTSSEIFGHLQHHFLISLSGSGAGRSSEMKHLFYMQKIPDYLFFGKPQKTTASKEETIPIQVNQ